MGTSIIHWLFGGGGSWGDPPVLIPAHNTDFDHTCSHPSSVIIIHDDNDLPDLLLAPAELRGRGSGDLFLFIGDLP